MLKEVSDHRTDGTEIPKRKGQIRSKNERLLTSRQPEVGKCALNGRMARQTW
jgi:hypothetical protein